MKAFFRRHLSVHLWALLVLCLLSVYFPAIRTSASATAFAAVTQRLKDAVGSLTNRVHFSVMECLIAGLVLGVLLWLCFFVRRLIRQPHRRKDLLYSGILGLVCLGGTIWGLYGLLWGVNYYADGFQEQSGIYAQPVAADDLEQVTRMFVSRLQELDDQVPRDEAGRFSMPREEILSRAPEIYPNLSQGFPFLSREDWVPKPMFFSRIFSAMNFTGFYSPFTGESNLNVDSPVCMLPATIAHELGHQRGIASEQECNFLAVAASTSCDDPIFQYSGCLMAYIHLGNALFRADRERWQQVRELLPPGAQADLHYQNVYWDQFEGVTARVSTKVYDASLKLYGEEDGIKSYGTCVDLLVAYYR